MLLCALALVLGPGLNPGLAVTKLRFEDKSSGPHAQVEIEEQREWARRAVDELPEKLRCVLVLTHFHGMNCRATAETLGIPLGTVKWRLYTALARLHSVWSSTVARDR
jgi:RNA polymerase sigma factor (sigma-70 family)